MTLREAYRIPREWKHPDVKKPYMIVCSQSKRLWTGVAEQQQFCSTSIYRRMQSMEERARGGRRAKQ